MEKREEGRGRGGNKTEQIPSASDATTGLKRKKKFPDKIDDSHYRLTTRIHTSTDVARRDDDDDDCTPICLLPGLPVTRI